MLISNKILFKYFSQYFKHFDNKNIVKNHFYIEAITLGKKHNIPLEFIDFSVKNYQPENIELPDDYVIRKIGLKNFYNHISNFLKKNNSEKKIDIRNNFDFISYIEKQNDFKRNIHNFEKDIMREMYMASRLLKLKQIYKKILVILGMAHWENIKYYLTHPNKVKSINTNLLPNEYIKIYNIRAKDARFFMKELPYSTCKWIKFKKKISKNILENIETSEELEKFIDTFDKKHHIKKIIFNSRDKYEKEFKEIISLYRLKLLFQYTRNLSIS